MPEPVRIVINATSERIYKCIKHKNEYIQFKVRAWRSGLDIGLFTTGDNPEENNPTYNIKVGHQPWTESLVALDRLGLPPNCAVENTPHILSINDWKGFWIWTANGTISFGKENECEPIISWPDRNFKPIEKIGFRVHQYPFIDIRDHLFDDPESDEEAMVRERAGEADIVVDTVKSSKDGSIISKPSGVRWVRCDLGEIPNNAVIGGHDNGNALYVVRATIDHALTPGKLMHGKHYCEVSWGGRENTLERYEVLTDFDGDWVKTSDDKIPPYALLAGRSEDDFPLYIGRTEYRGTLTLGKVQPNHKSLYIPYGGQELSFKTYEILCHKPPGPPVMPHPPILRTYEEKQPELKWVYSCHGRAPRNAFVAGDFMGTAVMLIRGKYQETWYPGWMHCEEDVGHIIGHHYYEAVEEFEVLCDFNGYWEQPSDSILPANALVIGRDPEHNNIYVGRASHLGNILCGPVDIRNMRCKIPYQKEELWKESFEILCYPNPVESITKKGLQYVKKWDL